MFLKQNANAIWGVPVKGDLRPGKRGYIKIFFSGKCLSLHTYAPNLFRLSSTPMASPHLHFVIFEGLGPGPRDRYRDGVKIQNTKCTIQNTTYKLQKTKTEHKIQQYRIQYTKYKIQKYKIQNTKYKIQNTKIQKYRNNKRQIQKTKDKIQNTKYKIQNTICKRQHTKVQLQKYKI